MKAFDPFLSVKIDNVQNEVLEVIVASDYEDAGQAEMSIETVLCIFANLIKSYDERFSFELTSDEEQCELLQDDMGMFWMNHTFIYTTIATMLKLGYLNEDNGYLSLNESCSLVNTRYNVYNRLEKQV